MTKPLRLLAQDPGDLVVISAALQDSIAKIGGIRFDPKARRLTMELNRFRWESGTTDRVRSVFQVGSVLAVQSRKLRRTAKDAVVEVLSVEFEPGEAPGGDLKVRFSGDGVLRVSVECIDAVLADVSVSWPAKSTPQHDV
jgi:Protein of unknown function (DUF2948)